ncbi:MAG TPA: lipid-A-disaccharide synthase, partial [Methylomirabilota bacterium]|nr:lipid-A-disaccharide synthase [Methylomirabilota bacterium]
MSAAGAPIMLSAGESSGDLHGGTLCRALRALAPDVGLVGMGGPRMAAAGMEIVADPTSHAVVGTSEAVGRLPALYRAYRTLVRRLREAPPRALVVIDFPEFNMRLARQARRAGVPVVFFIPPQVWAWRRGRVRLIARLASRVLAVFPFETALYQSAGVAVEFVGHPLLDVLPISLDRGAARVSLGVAPDETLVGLLPGSRREEITRLLPAMLDAARRLAAPAAGGAPRFLLGLAPSVDRAVVEALVAAAGRAAGAPAVEIVTQRTYELMAAADTILITSGTATLEAALLGAPMVVCYRVSRVTELLSRLLIRIPWISLPNIIAGRRVVPELLQDAASGERLAVEARRLLAEPAAAA